jgi:class 3 adenylate cyclase
MNTPVKRRLAAILAADAVGYSRMMAQDEEATLKILSVHRAVIDGIIAFHEGRIVNTAGDSVLAEFASPVQAVRCAVEIQDALKTRNDSLSEDQRLQFRIGINLGDVMVKGDDLLGDGVNIAARLEGIAEPGGISISSSIYDQITGKLNLGFVDVGEHALKNIDRPVRVYRVHRSATAAASAAKPSTSLQRAVPWIGGAVAMAVLAAITLWYLGALPIGRQPDRTATSKPKTIVSAKTETPPVKAPAAAATPAPRYAGKWKGMFACEAFEGSPASANDPLRVEVTNDVFLVERGTRDKPGSISVRGTPGADGTLLLEGNGIAIHPKYLGRPYPAKFDGRFENGRYRGSGKAGVRNCMVSIFPDK